MPANWLAELAAYLDRLDSVQRDFQRLFTVKQQALRTGDTAALQRLVQPESNLARHLQLLLGERQLLLDRARQQGLPAGSLQELHVRLDSSSASPLASRFARAAQRADDVRRECWVQWVVTQRATRHYGAILDLIANCGEKSPTYSQSSATHSTGGAILDASV